MTDKDMCLDVFDKALRDYAAAQAIEDVRLQLGIALGARSVMRHADVITSDEHDILCQRVTDAINAKYPQAVQP